MRKAIIAIAFAVLSLQWGWSQRVDKSVLSADSLLVGDQVVWTLDFSVPQGKMLAVAPYAEILARDTSIRGSVEVVREFELDTLGVKKNLAQLRGKILLTSFDSGAFRLPPPLILVEKDGGAEPDTLKIDSKTLYVNTIPVDTATFKMYDIKPQETYPVTFREVLPWILLGLGIALLIWGIARYIAMRRKNKDFFGRSIETDPPHIVALKKLEKIRSEKLWQGGKEKLFYTGVTDAVREYIEKRYAVRAMEQTSSEIMESLKDKKIDEKILSDLGSMFSTSDLVKFAKHSPAAEENEKAIPTAVNFVNFAYMQQLEESEVEKKKEEGE
ncbi:MAG: hypothetical protein IJK74_05200 [Bacteroidales bacterium]|nr:hypothetical protein [Bacteroidales bacterium]